MSITKKRCIAVGMEGSANKLGIGVVDSDGNILSNLRHTYITPPGTGFLPRETAQHHQEHIHDMVKRALEEAGITDPKCIIFFQESRFDILQHNWIVFVTQKDLVWAHLWRPSLLLHVF